MPWEKTISIEEERSRAWVDAMHHAYEKILNLPLMEGKIVRQAFQTNSELRSRLGMILLNAKKTFYSRDNTGIIRCKLDVPFNGKQSIKSALYLAALRPLPIRPISLLASWTRRLESKEKNNLPDLRRVVIDLRGTKFKPSLFPRFFDDKGFLIFQETMLSSHKRFTKPIVKFSEDILDSYKDLEENKVMMIKGNVTSLGTNDVIIPDFEATIFSRFCKKIKNSPLEKNEILLIYDPESDFGGKLSKTEKKKTKDKSK